MAFSEMTRLVSNSKDLTDESPIIHFENIDTFAPYVHRKSSSNLEFRTILFLSYSASCGVLCTHSKKILMFFFKALYIGKLGLPADVIQFS